MAIYIGKIKYSTGETIYRGFWAVTVNGIEGTVITCGQDKTIGENGFVVFRLAEPGTYTFTATRAGQTVTQSLTVTDEGSIFFHTLNMFIVPGYSVLEYIEATGTQYIDTGLYGTQNTSVKIIAESTDTVITNNRMLFGSRTSFGVNEIAIFLNEYDGTASTVTIDFDNIRFEVPGLINTKYTLYNSNNYRYEKHGDITNSDTRTTSNSFTTPSTLLLGKIGYNQPAVSLNFKGKIYSLEINESLVKVGNFIPAKRNSDEVVGMYDLVTNTFFENAGTGSFIPGPVLV